MSFNNKLKNVRFLKLGCHFVFVVHAKYLVKMTEREHIASKL